MRVFAAVDAVRARLPTDWTVTSLKRVAWLREDQNVGGHFGLLSLRNTGELAPRGDDVQPPSPEYIPRYWLVGEGNLVVNPMWLAGGAIGVSRVSGAVSPDYRVYELSGALNSRYVHHLVRSTLYNDQYRLLMRAETTFDRRVTKADFADLPLLLPPIATQRRVADLLDAETARIDALVNKKRRMIDLLEERWATTVRRRLGQVAPVMPLKRKWRVIDCKHRTPTYVDDGYPVVSPGDISPGALDLSVCNRFVSDTDFEDLTEGRRPARGDIIYSRNASAGIAAYVDTHEPFCMGQDVCLITSHEQDQRFLTYALNSLGKDQLEPIRIGSTITRINVDQIDELRIPTPLPEMQASVADALDSERALTDAARSRLIRQIELLREHRQALITASVTGEFDVVKAAA